jgi:hypothetical protein
MSEKRFTLFGLDNETIKDDVTKECYWVIEYVQRKKLVDLLNEQQATISKLEEEKGYWKSKAMTLLMQVRRLTPRMTDKEVIEFGKELEDE